MFSVFLDRFLEEQTSIDIEAKELFCKTGDDSVPCFDDLLVHNIVIINNKDPVTKISKLDL